MVLQKNARTLGIDEWTYHSTYRGIVIQVYTESATGITTYAAYFNDKWYMDTSLSGLKAKIDDFLGPEEPEPEPHWEYHSTYRGIDIQVWMPDGTPFTAYFDGKWHTAAYLSTLKAAIDDYLDEPEPEPEPPSLSMGTPSWPSSPQPSGAYLPVTLRNIYNSGGAGDNCVAALFDGVSGAVLDKTTFAMESGELIDSITLHFTMPNRTFGVVAQVGYDTHYTDLKSTVIQLEEVLAKGSIVSYDAPASANPGDSVTVSATVKNVGTGPGSFQLRLRDRDENVDVDSTGWFALAAGSTWTKSLTGTMPDRDWNLTLLLERTLPTGAVAVDDEKKFTAINIVNWWAAIRAWWNGLEFWQKALIVTGSFGSVIVGGVALERRER